jgi:hypothetical protein
MCYSAFNDIIDAIGAMDADVISIETSRSKMELLDAFKSYKYPNEIGPGRHPLAARAGEGGAGQLRQIGPSAALRRPALDQSGLRPEDPQMGGSPTSAGQYGGGRQAASRRGIWIRRRAEVRAIT